MNQEKWNKQN